MRALMNFMHRDGWPFHIIAEDCKTVLVGYRKVESQETVLVGYRKVESQETVLVGYRKVESQETLLRIIAKLGGDIEEACRSSNGAAEASGSIHHLRGARLSG
jgi:hypothetical protein